MMPGLMQSPTPVVSIGWMGMIDLSGLAYVGYIRASLDDQQGT